MGTEIRRGVLLEREGVIFRQGTANGALLHKEYEFLPRALEALRLFAQHNIAVRVVSHQPGAGADQHTVVELDRQTRRFLLEAALCGAPIEKVYYCTHAHSQDCLCRKPLPGMLLRAMKEGSWRRADTFMIGSSEADMEAASAAGCRGMLLRRDAFLTGEVRGDHSVEIASSLHEAAKRIVRRNVLQFDPVLSADWIPLSLPKHQHAKEFAALEKEPA
jgi:D-glycero-D-manno-heptose 1,7-bisphosphate phosphatase